MIDKERIARQFVKLVSIDAPSYREREMADYLTKELEELGFSVEEDDAWKVYGGNCGNLYAHRPGAGSPLPLGMHMDTVEPAKGKKQLCIRTEGSQATAQRCSEQMICPVWQQF